MSRSCGDCTACCVVLTIYELDKPAHAPCRWLKRGTRPCSVYAQRPAPCSGFQCIWLQGFPGIRRPDKSGLLWMRSGADDPTGDKHYVLEVRSGALHSREGRKVLKLARAQAKRDGGLEVVPSARRISGPVPTHDSTEGLLPSNL